MPRLAGKQGAVYFNPNGTNKIADIFNISFEFEQQLEECGVKLEPVETYQQGKLTGRLTGERYITDTNPTVSGSTVAADAALVGGSAVTGMLPFSAPNTGNNFIGHQIAWTFKTIATGATGAGLGFNVNGKGWIERVTQQNPRGAASEVWEIRVTDVMPTFTN